jgi:hypothetical protein
LAAQPQIDNREPILPQLTFCQLRQNRWDHGGPESGGKSIWGGVADGFGVAAAGFPRRSTAEEDGASAQGNLSDSWQSPLRFTFARKKNAGAQLGRRSLHVRPVLTVPEKSKRGMLGTKYNFPDCPSCCFGGALVVGCATRGLLQHLVASPGRNHAAHPAKGHASKNRKVGAFLEHDGKIGRRNANPPSSRTHWAQNRAIIANVLQASVRRNIFGPLWPSCNFSKRKNERFSGELLRGAAKRGARTTPLFNRAVLAARSSGRAGPAPLASERLGFGGVSRSAGRSDVARVLSRRRGVSCAAARLRSRRCRMSSGEASRIAALAERLRSQGDPRKARGP